MRLPPAPLAGGALRELEREIGGFVLRRSRYCNADVPTLCDAVRCYGALPASLANADVRVRAGFPSLQVRRRVFSQPREAPVWERRRTGRQS